MAEIHSLDLRTRREAEQANAAERQANYAAGQRALADGRKLIKEHEVEAQRLADKLERLVEANRTIQRANDELPIGKAEIEFPEAFNGVRATPARRAPKVEMWIGEDGQNLGTSLPAKMIQQAVRRSVSGYGPDTIEGTPGRPHRPLVDRVAIPHLDPARGWLWRGSETKQHVDPDREIALRYLGLVR